MVKNAGPMLEPCWHYFSLLGVSWACFVALAAFVVTPGRFFGILGRSRLDFGGFRVGLGRVLELPASYFSMFLLHASLQCKKNSGCVKTIVFPWFFLGFVHSHFVT